MARRWSLAPRSATAAPALHLAGHCRGPVPANTTGKGQKVLAAIRSAVLTCCRVKLRDQQRLERTGVLKSTRITPTSNLVTPYAPPATFRRRSAGLDLK